MTTAKVRCADCGCLPEECRAADSPNDCPNCTLLPCCCWTAADDSDSGNGL